MTAAITAVALTDELTIQTAAENKATLVAALGLGTDIAIDLGSFSELDAAGIQLLLLAKRECAELGVGLHLGVPAEAVLEILEIVGLDANLDHVCAAGVTTSTKERTL